MTKRMESFLLDGQYEQFFRNAGIDLDAVLLRAGLPENSFHRESARVSRQQYFVFLDTVWKMYPQEALPVRLGTQAGIESFSPAVFAAYCSKNGMMCLRRLRDYKRLIGPLEYVVDELPDSFTVKLDTFGQEIPPLLVLIEFTFLLHMLRKATARKIFPMRVITRQALHNAAVEEFARVPLEGGDADAIVFSRESLLLPFTTRNDMIWDYIAPELERRLHTLGSSDSFGSRVRSTLAELLPRGCGSADDVAQKLGISRRTLQRRLAEEDTTFQQELNRTRRFLAEHYLTFTDLPASNIAYLLGYRETNSFLHAFVSWTGMTVSEYKKDALPV